MSSRVAIAPRAGNFSRWYTNAAMLVRMALSRWLSRLLKRPKVEGGIAYSVAWGKTMRAAIMELRRP
jgi:hypothetical protein